MARYLQRARAVLQSLFRGEPAPQPVGASTAEPAGENVVVAAGRVTFLDRSKAASDPAAWLEAFTAATLRNIPVGQDALAIIEQHATRLEIEELLPTDRARERLIEMLRPRPGLSQRLSEMRTCGLLVRLLPEIRGVVHPAARAALDEAWAARALGAIGNLEQLLTEDTLSSKRFGVMLRELEAPELLVLTVLVPDPGEKRAEEAARLARAIVDRLKLSGGALQTIEFLIRNRPRMSQIAFRRDTGDPEVIKTFAAIFSTEEQLKMLCLITVADRQTGADALTPWRAELLWRLFVDTYNQLTMAYADEVIDKSEAAPTTLHANRPSTISEDELTEFLEGLPRRYLTLFGSDSIYEHVELCRNLGPDDVRHLLKKGPETWELTVVTLDRPYFFSNVCGVLSYPNLDIVRGRALTSLKSVVIDVFQFTDRLGVLATSQLDPLLSQAVSGRVDITALLREKEPTDGRRQGEGTAPVIYFDNESSHRYTILEIVADDSLGLLHRISRVISSYGCDVELVLISTEGHKAIDVFHLKRREAKLTDSDQLALTEDLERAL